MLLMSVALLNKIVVSVYVCVQWCAVESDHIFQLTSSVSGVFTPTSCKQ